MDFAGINSVQDLLKANELMINDANDVNNVMQVINLIGELDMNVSEIADLMMNALAYIKQHHLVMLEQKAEANDTEQVLLWSRDLTLIAAAQASLAQVQW